MPALLPNKLAQLSPTKLVPPENQPVWLGPSAPGWNGGVTQSMIGNYLSCRERFRVAYILGFQRSQQWEKSLGYGTMWHICEEALAAGQDFVHPLTKHTQQMLAKYPFQREEIHKAWRICLVQFPEYVKYWQSHPDVLDRQPLMQEQAFDVPYRLSSGRTVRLRGKFDSVDLIPSQGGVFLQENKTRGNIDPIQVQRQLRFDLQTCLYLVALYEWRSGKIETGKYVAGLKTNQICGVRYNIVRRPLSGGKGSIRPHTAKSYKNGRTEPAETDAEFYERLRRDYIAAEPEYWFVRFMSKVSREDIDRFKRQFLDPCLENLCDDAEWWLDCLENKLDHWDYTLRSHRHNHEQRHYRMPFGVWNPLIDGSGGTEYDEHLDFGTTAGLHRVERLFPELEEVR